MRESVEFRISEENVREYLKPEVGKNIGYGVVKVVLDTSDPLFRRIRRLDREFRKKGDLFFTGCIIRRHYTRRELAAAKLFHVWPKRFFEPAGEECGTTYDDTKACPECGAGAPQTSPLFLNGRRIPKVDFAQTIAGEIVASVRVVELFRAHGFTGAEFEAVRLSNRGGRPSEQHFQLKVLEQTVELDPATRAGGSLFDKSGEGRCSRGDVAGLNLLSEVTVKAASVPQADVLAIKQMIGVRRGLLRPQPILLLSPRALWAIKEAKLKGLAVEVAYLK